MAENARRDAALAAFLLSPEYQLDHYVQLLIDTFPQRQQVGQLKAFLFTNNYQFNHAPHMVTQYVDRTEESRSTRRGPRHPYGPPENAEFRAPTK